MTTPLPDLSQLTLYTKPGCHMCEQAHEALDAALAERVAAGLPVPAVVELDIEQDAELHRRYMVTIPVIAFAGRELEMVTSPAKVRRLLAETLDGAAA